jgi:nucleotide-binding universal stress UspA family protein
MSMAGLVVIGYDGSADADRAVDLAAGLLRVDAALVVNVWSPAVAAAEVPVPAGAPPPDADEHLERAARAVAEQGAERRAQPGCAPSRSSAARRRRRRSRRCSSTSPRSATLRSWWSAGAGCRG